MRSIIIFLLLNSVALASSFIAVYKIFRLKNFIDSLICWFTVYFAQIVLTELVLGILGVLYLKNIILLNAAILLTAWLLAGKRKNAVNLDVAKAFAGEAANNKYIIFTLAIISGFALVKVFVNLMHPPVGWDLSLIHI